MLEVHLDPDQAWSDGAQSLDARAFRELMGDLGRLAALRRKKVSPKGP
jgi:3-deoxy-D-arabino-heptulosonate 7-phosphate (DAHP) synthase